MSKKKILAVDDNAVNLATVEQALQEEYDVIPVLSGKRAIKYLGANRADLILLDIQMPEMDGIQTLQEIRKLENGAEIPVMFLTAISDRKDMAVEVAEGVRDYIMKPFDKEDLKSRIAYVLKDETSGA